MALEHAQKEKDKLLEEEVESIQIVKKENVKLQRASRQMATQHATFHDKIVENKSQVVLIQWKHRSALMCLQVCVGAGA